MIAALGRRIARARERMNELDIEVLLLSVGADLPYLTGYEAMPLERLTMLVLPAVGFRHFLKSIRKKNPVNLHKQMPARKIFSSSRTLFLGQSLFFYMWERR